MILILKLVLGQQKSPFSIDGRLFMLVVALHAAALA